MLRLKNGHRCKKNVDFSDSKEIMSLQTLCECYLLLVLLANSKLEQIACHVFNRKVKECMPLIDWFGFAYFNQFTNLLYNSCLFLSIFFIIIINFS